LVKFLPYILLHITSRSQQIYSETRFVMHYLYTFETDGGMAK